MINSNAGCLSVGSGAIVAVYGLADGRHTIIVQSTLGVCWDTYLVSNGIEITNRIPPDEEGHDGEVV